MKLRYYQHDAVHQLRRAVAKHGSSIYVCPTGSGKSIVAAEIARLADAKGSRTLFLLHRRELVKQMLGSLSEALPDQPIGVEAAGFISVPWARMQVASVQSLVRRDINLDPSLIIVDEVHHCRASSWELIFKRYPAAKRIGLTATPERLDGKGLGEHFGTMVLGPSIQQLVENIDPATGLPYLAPCRTMTIPVGLSLEGVPKTRHGEYQEKEVSKRITGGVVAKAADAYMQYARGKQAIFFGVHRDHSRRVCAELRQRGVSAEHVDGEDHTSRRDRVMAEFKDRRIQVVGNCDLISEGFDAPSCDAILMGSPTRSITRFLQQAGRAMRPGPDKTALILDLAGIVHELGLPDEPREWSLEDGEVREQRKKRVLPRACLKCKTAFYGRACPACRYEEPMAAVQEVETELHDASNMARPKPPRKKRSDVWRDLAIAKKSSNPRKAVEAIARRRGYKPGMGRPYFAGLGQGMKPLEEMGQFATVVVDPPWPVTPRQNIPQDRRPSGLQTGIRCLMRRYPSMQLPRFP